MPSVKLMLGDCLTRMAEIDDESVDMVLCDLPYGTTQCSWDTQIDLTWLWNHYRRIVKPTAAILLFAQTPFDKVLGCSNLSWLRYEWIWEKTAATGFLNAKKQPLKAHENILVFYQKSPVYTPQMVHGQTPTHSFTKRKLDVECYGKTRVISGGGDTTRYPRSVQVFAQDTQKLSLHTTQKPLKLCMYLIKTYTKKGDLVLDNCFGSGTTAAACIRTGRNFIGIEKDSRYFKVACRRVKANLEQVKLLKRRNANSLFCQKNISQ
jgi:DNA modification methylase